LHGFGVSELEEAVISSSLVFFLKKIFIVVSLSHSIDVGSLAAILSAAIWGPYDRRIVAATLDVSYSLVPSMYNWESKSKLM